MNRAKVLYWIKLRCWKVRSWLASRALDRAYNRWDKLSIDEYELRQLERRFKNGNS